MSRARLARPASTNASPHNDALSRPTIAGFECRVLVRARGPLITTPPAAQICHAGCVHPGQRTAVAPADAPSVVERTASTDHGFKSPWCMSRPLTCNKLNLGRHGWWC